MVFPNWSVNECVDQAALFEEEEEDQYEEEDVNNRISYTIEYEEGYNNERYFIILGYVYITSDRFLGHAYITSDRFLVHAYITSDQFLVHVYITRIGFWADPLSDPVYVSTFILTP